MSRQPLTSRAAAVAIVGLVAVALRHAGIAIPPDVREAVIDVLAISGPLIAAYWARRHVTPTADPRAADGTPLVPAPATATPDGIDDDMPPAVAGEDGAVSP